MPEIYLEGWCGVPPWDDEAHFTAASVRAELAALDGGPVTVLLNSPGGLAAEGLAIYHALRDYAGAVSIIVTGVAVSAASLVAMAGDEIVMRAGSMMMIHDPAVPFIEGRGTEDDHRAMAESLRRMSEGYAAIYAGRAGITAEAAREVMRAETWFTPEEALAAGFATRAEDEPAKAAAASALGIYKNPPRHLLDAARAGGPSKRAVMAWIGASRPVTQMEGTRMDPEEEQDLKPGEGEDTTEGSAGDDLPPAEGEGDDTIEGGDAGPEGDDAEEEADPAAEATAAICDLVEMNGGTAADAGRFIASGMTLQSVMAHYREKGQNVPKPQGGQRARIIRDERDTRRAGMAAALAAQFGRRDPTDDRARAFMQMSLAEMAAASLDSPVPLRTASDRLNVFMNMHTRDDFPVALSGAINTVLLDRYRAADPVYRMIARARDFMDFRPHTFVNPQDFPMLEEVPESGEIKRGTIGDGGETVTLVPYGRVMTLSRQVLINDHIGAIADAIADQGRMITRFEEKTFFAICFAGDGPTLSNTRAVFNATDKTKAAAGAAITVGALSAGRAEIRKHKDASGEEIGLAPKFLLTSPDKETEAEQMTASLVPAEAAQANPFSQKLVPITASRLSGNAWYLLADPADAPVFTYGFLQGAGGPRLRMEEMFGQQGVSWSVEHDFAAGATGRAGAWKNPGA